MIKIDADALADSLRAWHASGTGTDETELIEQAGQPHGRKARILRLFSIVS